MSCIDGTTLGGVVSGLRPLSATAIISPIYRTNDRNWNGRKGNMVVSCFTFCMKSITYCSNSFGGVTGAVAVASAAVDSDRDMSCGVGSDSMPVSSSATTCVGSGPGPGDGWAGGIAA